MPSGIAQQIDRVTTGLLNTVNDALPGQSVSSGTGAARYSGQLGARLVLGPDEVKFDSSIGTLFGGIYQYVRFAAGAVAVPARGKLCFWDTSVAEDLYQVTCDEGGLTQGANLVAGVVLNAVTAGNYGFIQVAGKVGIKFRAVLTGVTAAGVPVFAAGAGAGADVATADVLGSGANPTFAQMVSAFPRFLGVAEAIPVAGAISTVSLQLPRFRV
jgi:hypothetical protein